MLDELVALRWRDVEFAGSALTVARAMSAGVESTTKSGRVRRVPLADQAAGHDLGLLNPALYDHGDNSGPGRAIDGVVDVTRGNTTVTFENPAGDPFPGTHTVPGFSAVRGYDLATGLGTANGTALVAELAGRHGYKRH